MTLLERLAPKDSFDGSTPRDPDDHIRQAIFNVVIDLTEDPEFCRLVIEDTDGMALEAFVDQWIDRR